MGRNNKMQKLKINTYEDAESLCRILAVNGHKVWMLTEFESNTLGTNKRAIYYVCFEERISK